MTVVHRPELEDEGKNRTNRSQIDHNDEDHNDREEEEHNRSDSVRGVVSDPKERRDDASSETRRWWFFGDRNARAWCGVGAAHEIVSTTALLSSLSFLRIATTESGDGTVVAGLRPSSVLTASQVVAGVVVAITMPLWSRLLDDGNRRVRSRLVAMATGVVTIVWTYAAAFLISSSGSRLSTTVVVGFGLNGAIFFLHTMSAYASYLSKSSDLKMLSVHDRTLKLVRLAAVATTILLYFGTRFYYDWVSGKCGTDHEMASARAFLIASATLTVISFGFSWTTTPRRPSVDEDDETERHAVVVVRTRTVPTLRDAATTCLRFWNDRRPLFWYWVASVPFSLVFLSAGGVGLTYLVATLRTEFSLVGIGVVVFGVSGAVGNLVDAFVSERFNELTSFKGVVASWVVGLAYIGACLYEPGQNVAFLVSNGVLGILFGWTGRSSRALHAVISPTKKERAETTGLYVFSCASTFWVLPFAATFLNELGLAPNRVILLGIVPLSISFVALVAIGDSDDDVAATKSDANADEEFVTTDPTTMDEKEKSSSSSAYEHFTLMFPSRGTVYFYFETSVYDYSPHDDNDDNNHARAEVLTLSSSSSIDV